jgi:hypothetical protein
MWNPGLSRLLAATAICAAAVSQTRPASSRSASQQSPDNPPAAGELRLKPYIVNDPQLGVEAFRFLMPASWKAEGGVVWRSNPTRPATVSIRVYNPAGVEEIGAVPDIPCVWAPTLPAFGFPPGSFYLGNEVRPPMGDAIQCLRGLVLPRYSSRLTEARIVSQESLPEMAQSWAAANYPDLQGRANFTGGKVRIEYEYEGKPVEMDSYAVEGAWTTPIQGVPMTFWGVGSIRYSRAAKGKLDEQYKLFQTMLYSEKLNIEWLNRYSQVRDLMIQNQIDASNRAVQLSRYLSRVNNQISDTIRRSYEQRQAALDRANANFDRYIRGVNQYHNPFDGGSVELPSGYRQVWANSLGEYILSDNANFNPNVSGTQNWRLLQGQR